MGKPRRKSRRLTKKEKLDLLNKLANKLTADEADYINAAVNRRIDEAKTDVFIQATATAYAVIFMVLRDKFGFEREELRKAWEHTDSYANDISSGALKLRDLVDTLREEAGIEIALYENEDEEVTNSGGEKE